MSLISKHDVLERNASLLLVASLLVVTVGGIVEIAPLFYLENTIEAKQANLAIYREAATIAFELPDALPVTVQVYDVNGRLVRTLRGVASGSGIGSYNATWDGRDQERNPLGSGIYYIRLSVGGQELTRSLMLLR